MNACALFLSMSPRSDFSNDTVDWLLKIMCAFGLRERQNSFKYTETSPALAI